MGQREQQQHAHRRPHQCRCSASCSQRRSSGCWGWGWWRPPSLCSAHRTWPWRCRRRPAARCGAHGRSGPPQGRSHPTASGCSHTARPDTPADPARAWSLLSSELSRLQCFATDTTCSSCQPCTQLSTEKPALKATQGVKGANNEWVQSPQKYPYLGGGWSRGAVDGGCRICFLGQLKQGTCTQTMLSRYLLTPAQQQAQEQHLPTFASGDWHTRHTGRAERLQSTDLYACGMHAGATWAHLQPPCGRGRPAWDPSGSAAGCPGPCAPQRPSSDRPRAPGGQARWRCGAAWRRRSSSWSTGSGWAPCPQSSPPAASASSARSPWTAAQHRPASTRSPTSSDIALHRDEQIVAADLSALPAGAETGLCMPYSTTPVEEISLDARPDCQLSLHNADHTTEGPGSTDGTAPAPGARSPAGTALRPGALWPRCCPHYPPVHTGRRLRCAAGCRCAMPWAPAEAAALPPARTRVRLRPPGLLSQDWQRQALKHAIFMFWRHATATLQHFP